MLDGGCPFLAELHERAQSHYHSQDAASAAGGFDRQTSRGAGIQIPTRSVLQEQRGRVVPPLPRVLANLKTDFPRFEEVPAEPRLLPFSQFRSLVPLLLRGPDIAGLGGDVAQTQSPGAPAMVAELARGGIAMSTESSARSASDSNICETSAGSSESTAAASSGTTTPYAVQGSSGRALRVGIVFAADNSKVPAHPVNVLAGLFGYLSVAAPGSRVIGFLDGPDGLLSGRSQELSEADVLGSLNQGGWRLLNYGTCSDGGFTVEERAEDVRAAAAVCCAERLDTLIVVAGPRDLSWAASLAVGFVGIKCHTTVIAVPHSKNCSLYIPHFMPITLGFDSARRMASEVVGNIMTDALSSKKYWHFIRCGEDNVTLEVALQTRCTASVLTRLRPQSEKDESHRALKDSVAQLVQVIERRRAVCRPSGVVLVSADILHALPEMEKLKEELLEICGAVEGASKTKPPSLADVERQLKSDGAKELFKRLPRVVQWSLILQRDADGKPQERPEMSMEAERILGRFVQQEIPVKASFAPRFHTVELMSNAPMPSPFDCAFGYVLGHTAAALACEGRTFYVASCANMHLDVAHWEPCAVPFSYLAETGVPEAVNGANVAESLVVSKAASGLRKNLVEAYHYFREAWVENNVWKGPGPMQFGDGGDVGPQHDRPFTLLAEYLSLDELKQLIQPITTLPLPLRVSPDPAVDRDVRVTENLSTLEQHRLKYKARVPSYLRGPIRAQEDDITPQASDKCGGLERSFPLTHGHTRPLQLVRIGASSCKAALEAAQKGMQHELRVGIVFSSNQVPGFHNVVAGLFDYLAQLTPPAKLIGFLCGYQGLIKGWTTPIDKTMVDQYRNLGGQDMLCQFGDPNSLAFKDHLKAVTRTIQKLHLDGLVLVGSLDWQVDSAFIAEACAAERLRTHVIGVPVSVHCDFPFVQQTIGYDTACKTLSAYIGDLGNLAETSGNLWIFIRIMGDATSHIAVECCLQSQPNLVLLSGGKVLGQRLESIVKCICDIIVQRHELGRNYGVVLLPMGFVADIAEMRLLFHEIIKITASGVYKTDWDSIGDIAAKLKPSTAALFQVFPRDVQYEICFGGRERGTNKIDLSSISAERLLLRFVEIEFQRRRRLGLVKQDFFRGTCFPMVYQERSALPTSFDCDLAYTLGWGAGLFVNLKKSGLLVHATNLTHKIEDWIIGGLPLTCFLKSNFDPEADEHIIKGASVQLLKQRGVIRPFSALPRPEHRTTMYHGPVQYWGEAADLSTSRSTWYMENQPVQDPIPALRLIAARCSELQSSMAMAKVESTLYAVNSVLENAVKVMDSYKALNEASERISPGLTDAPVEQVVEAWRTKAAGRGTSPRHRMPTPTASPDRM